MTDALKKQHKKEPVYVRFQNGALVPADVFARKQLERKKLKEGSVLKAYISKLRNPRFNRLVHKLGVLVVQNIDDFSGMSAHAAIKRIQLEGDIYCEEIRLKIFGFDFKIWVHVREVVQPILNKIGFSILDNGYLAARSPMSLSFDSMDEEQFHDAARRISAFIADRYWSSMTAEKIEQMAECMVDE